MNAGLSQLELARRAGVTQSVVNAYESGRRQPSLPMLARLAKAAGSELEMTVRPDGPRRRRLGGDLGRKLRSNRQELREAAARYGVSNVRVFGSVARGEDTADSDIDLLVDLPVGASLFTVARLQRRPRSHPRCPRRDRARQRPQTTCEGEIRARPSAPCET
jgi:hypothetical protein